MTSLSSIRSSSLRARAYVGVLLGLCVLLRALIPVGYMPGNLLAGEFMILCPQGVPEAFLGNIHSGHAGHAQSGDSSESFPDADRSCPIGSALVPAAPPPVEPLSLTAALLFTGSIENVVTEPVIAPQRPYQSRAPPPQLI